MAEFTSSSSSSSSIPTIESKLNKAEQYKIQAYTKGLPGSKRGLSGMSEMASQNSTDTPITEEEEKRSILIETTVQTNLSVCYLKLDNGIKSLEHAKKALELNPQSWKALLRKGEALILLKNYELAASSLKDSFHLADETQKRSVTTIQSQLAKLLKIENEKQKKAFKGLFERASKEEAKDDEKQINK